MSPCTESTTFSSGAAQIRDGIPEGPRTLLREYIARGHLGVKSGRGFYSDYRVGDEDGR
jgi:3-hydroxyacyl-CoA dehydrogenase